MLPGLAAGAGLNGKTLGGQVLTIDGVYFAAAKPAVEAHAGEFKPPRCLRDSVLLNVCRKGHKESVTDEPDFRKKGVDRAGNNCYYLTMPGKAQQDHKVSAPTVPASTPCRAEQTVGASISHKGKENKMTKNEPKLGDKVIDSETGMVGTVKARVSYRLPGAWFDVECRDGITRMYEAGRLGAAK